MTLPELKESKAGSCMLPLEGQGRPQPLEEASFSLLVKMNCSETITDGTETLMRDLVILPKHVDFFHNYQKILVDIKRGFPPTPTPTPGQGFSM